MMATPIEIVDADAPPSGVDGAPGSPIRSRLVEVEATWFSRPPPPREYLLRDLRTGHGALPRRGLAILGAAGGAGKGYARTGLAVAIASGRPWLGVLRPEITGRVLLVTAEDPADEERRRLYSTARAIPGPPVPAGSIDVVDIHDVLAPLLGRDGAPTEHARALVELVEERGPYALVVVDPIARIAGADIDADNATATALATVLEGVATAARGIVLGVHHTSLAARRASTVDATALRGVTALGDAARMVMILGVEEVGPAAPDRHLAEIVTLHRAKANHVRRWAPIELRRSEEGVLLPLDDTDRAMVEEARTAAEPSERRRERRQAEARDRVAQAAEAIRAALAEVSDGLSYRGLRAVVRARQGACSDVTLDAALAALGTDLTTESGSRGATVHRLSQRLAPPRTPPVVRQTVGLSHGDCLKTVGLLRQSRAAPVGW